MRTGLLGRGSPIDLPSQVVDACLSKSDPLDKLFRKAWKRSLASLKPDERRGRLAPVTGHIAESVAAVLLVEAGCHVVWQFIGPGQHGVDLIVADAAVERLIAVEVKGTLRSTGWPRLSKGELAQMSAEWLDKRDNPGMAEWGLEGADVYGAVILIQFALGLVRCGVTADFVSLSPLQSLDELALWSWPG